MKKTEGSARLHRLFLQARYFWPPPRGGEAEIDRFEKEWRQVEERLDEEDLAGLRREVSLRPEKPNGDGMGVVGSEPTEEQLLAALPTIREVVRLMEAVYLRTGFGDTDRSPSHHRFMGWLNRFGIWAVAPTFRLWWPWLAPFRAVRFTAFMANTFDLKLDSLCRGKVHLRESGKPEGLATHRFLATVGEKVAADALTLCYVVSVPPESPEPSKCEVAVLWFEKRGDRAIWKRPHLYVLPGLWGLGIGDSFLGEVCSFLRGEGYVEVEMMAPEELSTYEESLYGGVGFRREGPSLVLDLESWTGGSREGAASD